MATNTVIRIGLIWLSRKMLDATTWREREIETCEVVPIKGLGSEGCECTRSSTCGGLRAGDVRRDDKRERC